TFRMADDDMVLDINKQHFGDRGTLCGEVGAIPEVPSREENVTFIDDQLNDGNGTISGSQLTDGNGPFPEKQPIEEIRTITDDRISDEKGVISNYQIREENGAAPGNQVSSEDKTLPNDKEVEENQITAANGFCRADSQVADNLQYIRSDAMNRKQEELEAHQELSQPETHVQHLDDTEMNDTNTKGQQQLHEPGNENNKTEVMPELLVDDILAEVHNEMKINYSSLLLHNLSIEPEALIYPIFEKSFQAVVRTYQSEMQRIDMDEVLN
ncbi:hypothetical protein Ocin01_19108, partial [Orchesella cincta]